MTETTRGAEATVDVAIVGGGISGLAAAWRLQQDSELSYAVLEQSDRWGGKVRSERVEGIGDEPFVIEVGPDSFLTQKPWALELARELGLEARILNTNDQARKTRVLVHGKTVPLPEGVMLIVPTKFAPFALSPLFSPLGKLRMGLELFIPARRDDADETLADFIRRRLGSEALDRMAEPLLSGIYNSEAEQQSILATFPRLRALEKTHGSLIRGMLASRRNHSQPQRSPGTPGASMFASFDEGTETLINGLVDQLRGDLRLRTGVVALRRSEDGYALELSDGTRLQAQHVIVTIPSNHAAKLLAEVAPGAVSDLNSIRYTSTGTISLAYPNEAIRRPLDGFGLVIPRTERRPINAITVSSTKFARRAPKGHTLLRVFFGGARSPQTMKLDDEQVLDVVRKELRSLLGITTPPLFHRIYRWVNAMPQYDLNHLERVERIEASLPEGVYVTGSAYRGPGLPDCIHQASQVAQRLLQERHEPARH